MARRDAHDGDAYDDAYHDAHAGDADADEGGDEEHDDEGRPVLYDDGPRANRRPLIVGIVALVLVTIAVIVFVASRGDDEPPATFSLGVAAANAGAAERVAYDLSVRLDGQVVTSASGVLDLTSGSQQIVPDAADDRPSGFVFDAPERAIYVDAHAFESTGLVFERPYVRIDLDQLGDGVQLDTGTLMGRYGGDPLEVIALLGRTKAQDLGAETIDEEQVEHFRVELTLESLLEANVDLRTLLQVPDDAETIGDASAADPSTTIRTTTTIRTAVSTVVGTDATTGAEVRGTGNAAEVVVDVFVTEQNVVRRLVFTTSVSGAATGTITFREYDGDAKVEVPASGQVIALADAFGR